MPLPGMLDDGLSHPPPTSGPFAYNTAIPPNTIGYIYTDPVFGADVRRVSADVANDNTYTKNMWWNADETRYFHRGKIINVVTNTVEYTGLPVSNVSFQNPPVAGSDDEGFDPVDPNVYWYFTPTTIQKITLLGGGTWNDTVFFTAPGGQAMWDMGSTLNWWNGSGRYFVVRYKGSEPSVYLYDKLNLGAGPYANPIDGTINIDLNGYVGITSDGNYLVGSQQMAGQIRPVANVSWAINHSTRTVAAVPNIFSTLCGDHGAYMKASDGRNYFLTFNCFDIPSIVRMDITQNADGLTAAQQRALPNFRQFLVFDDWADTNGHFTCTQRGPYQDWGFADTENSGDVFNSGVSPWSNYRQEIMAVNVITNEVRRLAHHRSRSVGADFFHQPRISSSWAGKYVSWASNYNVNAANNVDIFAVPFAPAEEPPVGGMAQPGEMMAPAIWIA